MKAKKNMEPVNAPRVIRWEEIHRRLEAVQIVLNQGWSPSEQGRSEILRARAYALAQEPTSIDALEDQIEVVEFQLAYERYAVESMYVREVYPMKELTPLPCTPAFVLGVINLRGKILSVLDLKKFFDLPDKGLTDLNKVIVLYDDRMEFGILADVILGVRRIATSELQLSLPTFTGIREEYLKGVSKERTTILDAQKLLADPQMVVCEEVQ